MTAQAELADRATSPPSKHKNMLAVALGLALPLSTSSCIAGSGIADSMDHGENRSKIIYWHTSADPRYPATLTLTSDEANLVLRTNGDGPAIDRVGLFRQAMDPDVLRGLLPRFADRNSCMPQDAMPAPADARRYVIIMQGPTVVHHCEMTRLPISTAEQDLQALARTLRSKAVRALALEQAALTTQSLAQTGGVSFQLELLLSNPGVEALAIADSDRSATLVLVRTDVPLSTAGSPHRYLIPLAISPDSQACEPTNGRCHVHRAPEHRSTLRLTSEEVAVNPGDYSARVFFRFDIEDMHADEQVDGFELRSQSQPLRIR